MWTHVGQEVGGTGSVRVGLGSRGGAILLGGRLGLRWCVSVDRGELGRDSALGGGHGGRVCGSGCGGRAHGG